MWHREVEQPMVAVRVNHLESQVFLLINYIIMSRRNTTQILEFENEMRARFPDIFDILIRIERLLQRNRVLSNSVIIQNVRQNLITTAQSLFVQWRDVQENMRMRILYVEAVRAMGLLFENTHPALEVYSDDVRDQANINMICELNNWILNNMPEPLVNENNYSSDDGEYDINASHGGRKRKSRKTRKTRK
jgi:hypothetical protein